MKKPIRAKSCKYMPVAENTVIIFSHKRGDGYEAGFTIGNQYFTVGERETKPEASWMCNMLETAFKSLSTPKCIGLMHPDNIKIYEDTAGVKITVINKK